MSQETVLVNFKARGDKKLIRSMYALAEAQARLEKNTKNANLAMSGYTSSLGLGVRNTRNITDKTGKASVAFSVFRSKLLLASFGAGLFSKTLGQMSKKYAEQERAEIKLRQAFGQSTAALTDYASALQQKTIFGDEDIINVQAQIAMFVKDERQIKKVTKAALDLAAAKGMDLRTAGDLMAKSIGSSTNALSRYGVEIDNSLRGTDRLNAIVDSSNKLFEGQAEAQGDTFGGSLAKMSNAMGDMGETIGEALTPIIGYFAETLTSVAESFRDVFEWMGLVDSASDKIRGDIISEVAEWSVLKDSLKGVTEESDEFIKVRDKFIQANPKYFEGMSKEEIKVNDLTKAIDEYNDSMMASMQIKLAELAMQTQMDELALLIENRIERERKAYELGIEMREEFVDNFMESNEENLLRLAEQQEEYPEGGGWMSRTEDQQRFIGNYLENYRNNISKDVDKVIEEMHAQGLLFDSAGKGFFAMITDWDMRPSFDDMLSFDISDEWITRASEYYMLNENQVDEHQKKLQERIEFGNEVIAEILAKWMEDYSKFSEDFTPDVTLKVNTDEIQKAKTYIDSLNKSMVSFWLNSQGSARTWEQFGNVVIRELERIVSTFLANWLTWKLMRAILMPLGGDYVTWFNDNMGKNAPTLLPNFSNEDNDYHNGGMIQSYHQGGDVPIMAQEGEFVMRRSAVESIGLENLNRMNRTGQSGGVNINFSGNVLSGDFIENEAIPKIKDAVRRGADIGIS